MTKKHDKGSPIVWPEPIPTRPVPPEDSSNEPSISESARDYDQQFLDYLMDLKVDFKPITREQIDETMIPGMVGVIQDPDALMPDWHQDAYSAMVHNVQQFGQTLDMAYGAAAEQSKYLNEMSRIEADKMNKFLADQFAATTDPMMEQLRGTLGAYRVGVEEMMSGQLPASVRQDIDRMSAERGLSQGLFGDAAAQRGVRDAGVSALDYIKMGQDQMGTLSAAMGTFVEAQRPPTIQPELADTEAMGAAFGQSLMGMTTIAPETAMQAGFQQAQMRVGIETFNQQMFRSNWEMNVNRLADWLRFNSSQGLAAQQTNAQLNYAAALSNLNYSLEQQAHEWNYKIARAQARAQENAAMWSTIGNIAGAAGTAMLLL